MRERTEVQITVKTRPYSMIMICLMMSIALTGCSASAGRGITDTDPAGVTAGNPVEEKQGVQPEAEEKEEQPE